jgi:signal transduction histidine kinase
MAAIRPILPIAMPYDTAAGTDSQCPPGMMTHPLEVFPVFRRWRRSAVRDLVYTLLWNTMIAGIFLLIGLLFDSRSPLLSLAWGIFVLAQTIGFAIFGLFMIGDRIVPKVHRSSTAARALYYTTLTVVGVFIGYWVGAEILGMADFRRWIFSPRGAIVVIVLAIVITAILLAIFMQRERAARAEAAMAQEQARVAAAERETATARYKLLAAQVEPHFLFNTLAHVVSLIDREPATARHMIERLIDLLRATAAAPQGDGTLAEQLDWLRAYLEILELRMGGRLVWRIDVPSDLMGLVVPPMVLQPVVENAIKHGLEPKIEGGRLEISAQREGDGVRLTVRDSGLGFEATPPASSTTSLGLANLRARLAAWYGNKARLVIEDNRPSGACVSVLLPPS